METPSLLCEGCRIKSRCGVAPVAVVYPRGFLAVFAAVLGTAATAALCELALELLPFATLVVGALANPSTRLVLAAEVPHYHAGPVLHVLGVVSHGELLNEREDVHIIWK